MVKMIEMEGFVGLFRILSNGVKTKVVLPEIKHELENLPPYDTEDEITTIIIKNLKLSKKQWIDKTYLTFSWDKDLLVKLDYGVEENEKFVLKPKEEKIFKIRLPEPSSRGSHEITIVTEYGGWGQKEKFHIYARK